MKWEDGDCSPPPSFPCLAMPCQSCSRLSAPGTTHPCRSSPHQSRPVYPRQTGTGHASPQALRPIPARGVEPHRRPSPELLPYHSMPHPSRPRRPNPGRVLPTHTTHAKPFTANPSRPSTMPRQSDPGPAIKHYRRCAWNLPNRGRQSHRPHSTPAVRNHSSTRDALTTESSY